MANNKELAKKIIDFVGSKSNIVNAFNCYTRVRINVKNIDVVKQDEIKNLDGVIGLVIDAKQVQVIVGPGKSVKVAQDVNEILESMPGESAKEEVKEDKKENKDDIPEGKEYLKTKKEVRAKTTNVFSSVIRKIAGVFVPIIPMFVACGFLLAIYTVIAEHVTGFSDTNFGKIFNIVSSSVFTVLNVIVGYNATKEFGGDGIIGAALAGILTNPILDEIQIGSLKFSSSNGGIFAVLMVAISAAYFEKLLRKFMPEIIDAFVTPFVTVVVMSAVGLFAFQPLGGYMNDGLEFVFEKIVKYCPYLLGIVPMFYLLLVLTGTHHSLMVVSQSLIGRTGVTYLMPVQLMAGAAEFGAAIYVVLKTKNKKFKKTIASAMPIGFLGIDEPLIWGMSVPLKNPFISAGIGGAIGGTFIALMKISAKVPESTGIQAAFVTNKPLMFAIGYFISIAAGFVVQALLGFKDPVDETNPNVKPEENSLAKVLYAKFKNFTHKNNSKKNLVAVDTNTVYAPFDGEVKPIESLKDQTFASKMMGDGIAIVPNSNEVYSPINGKVTALLDTNHAYGLTSDSGYELLVHIGQDTVKLKGECFKSNVKNGDTIKVGDLLGTFERKEIIKKGYNIDTPVILIEGDYKIKEKKGNGKVKHGDVLFTVEK